MRERWRNYLGFISFVFRGQSIRFKLLFYFLSLILFPIVTLGLLGNVIYTRSIEEQTNVHTVQMIQQVTRNVEFYIHDMENITHYIAQEPQVIEFLRTKEKNSNAPLEKEVRRTLTTFTDVHPEIAGILIVNKNDLFISNEMYRIARDPLTMETWYRQAAAFPGKIQLFSKPIGRNITTRLKYSADDVVAIAKAVIDPDSKETLGVILIDMKLDIIKKVIEDIKLGKNGFLFIIDPNGGIVYAPVNAIVYRVNPDWLTGQSDSIVKMVKGSLYQIIYKESNYTKWKTIGVFPLNETLTEVTNIRYYSLLIGAFTLLLAVIAAFFFTSAIAKPLSKLRSLMKMAEEGDLNVHFNSKYNDEIGQLGNSFNNMIEEIRKLIDLVYKEQKSKREAELKTLQAQIKPHFLYNTLDTIKWMAQGHGADDIVEIISALANLFRIGISKGKEMIKVGEELEHIKSYLIIQKARYEDRLSYEINFEEEIMNFYVIKLILQPLVENAIYHGINAKRGGGAILINAQKTEGKLHFVIKDNGIGITPEKMQQIRAMLENKEINPDNPGYGTFNVHERIRLSFGNEFGIQFTSIYGEGTTVEIWHPLVER
ncbi:signal transduction histidine kinase internal region [Lucifera butyrica]|uniref:Signal transduction histidine kinase internal region n=1 Tax=Lucifera butyrica TaxID=1351585 RepID=A0A498R9R3_9FIRM|nr:sensor histidine kinase [Lucifera butyrica]VBB08121.1 signal transduction histidine kinase internal region [Lucifera butyrica]